MKKVLLCASIVSAASLSYGADLDLDEDCNYNGTLVDSSWSDYDVQCNLPANINVAGTIELARENDFGDTILWALPEVVTVGNGHLNTTTLATATDVTLEIEEGVEIVGLIPNSALVITRGAKIEAVGTADDPIIFSSVDTDYGSKNEWGGLIVSSFGTSNECPTTGNCLMEGISADSATSIPYYYGGTGTAAETSASSGTLSYVVITEGGVEIRLGDQTGGGNANYGNEINGLTLYAVNDTTTISNVHVNDNYDDGIEFFGGDVDVQNLWLTCNKDDSVDWDEGYTGDLTNVSILQHDGSDHAFELASNASAGDLGASPLPRADGSVLNASIMLTSASAGIDVPFKIKEATLASFTNVVIDSRYGSPSNCDNISANSAGTFSTINYACSSTVLPASSASATGFTAASFWTAAKGNPYAAGSCQ